MWEHHACLFVWVHTLKTKVFLDQFRGNYFAYSCISQGFTAVECVHRSSYKPMQYITSCNLNAVTFLIYRLKSSIGTTETSNRRRM